MKGYSFVVVMLFLNHLGMSQVCPSSSFSISSDFCKGESLNIANTSSGGVEYLWDFCANQLSGGVEAEVVTQNSIFQSAQRLNLVQDAGNFYGFLPAVNSSSLIRLEFGNDLDTNPQAINLGNVEDAFNIPIEIAIVEEDDEYYGILINRGSETLVRLSFGASLSNVPTTEILTGLGLDKPVGLEIIKEGADYYGIISNFDGNKITSVRFLNSITGTVSAQTHTIAGGLLFNGISMIKECDTWSGIVASGGNSSLIRLIFGSDLLAAPTSSVVEGFNFAAPRDLDLEREGESILAHVILNSGNVIRLDFSDDLLNAPSVTDLGDLGGILATNSQGITIDKFDGISYGFIINSINRIDRLNFTATCDVQPQFSIEQDPSGVFYNQSGDVNVSLTVTDMNGNIDHSEQAITILDQTAPDIDFVTQNSLCVSAPVTFIPQNSSEDIDTYLWDFQQELSMLETPEINFNNAQVYNVSLEVSNTNCSNNITKSIEIYNPPIPDFINPGGTLCSGDVLTFTNNTSNIPGTPGVITYEWNFNGEGSSTDSDPTFTFSSGGLKDITLTTSIPGCTDFISKSINVLDGPVVDFTFNEVCFGETVNFTDLTTGPDINPASYIWDFGDGNMSNDLNPSHDYAAPGDYTVSLSVSNTNCTLSNSKTIAVHAIPIADFTNEQACIGPVQFTDASSVDAANITQWQWDFGNGTTSEERNPIAQFDNNVDFDVTLIATSNFGCSDNITKTVSVLSAPVPEFSFDLACLGDPTSFRDETTVADINPVNAYFWQINGEVYTDMNPVHTFSEADTVLVTMTLSMANSCVVSSTQEIIIPGAPIPNFIYTSACVNSVITFEDQSVADTNDPVRSQSWDFAGLGSATGSVAQFIFEEPGTYNVSLIINTELGCAEVVTKEIVVNEQPIAAFVPSTEQGPPPLEVDFLNQSQESSTYFWLLNDSVDPFSAEENTSFRFEQEGDFEVSLVAFNPLGCSDTARQVIQVAFPEVDLVLNEVLAVDNEEITNIVLRGANRGTLPINGFDIVIDLDNGTRLIERFDQTLHKEEEFVHPLNFEIITSNNTLDFLCVELQIEEEEPTDNNQGCVSFDSQLIIQDPFPNPVSDMVRVNLILPEAEDQIQLSFMDIYGKVFTEQIITDSQKGLNTFDFDVRTLDAGTYLVRIRYAGIDETRRVSVE